MEDVWSGALRFGEGFGVEGVGILLRVWGLWFVDLIQSFLSGVF